VPRRATRALRSAHPPPRQARPPGLAGQARRGWGWRASADVQAWQRGGAARAASGRGARAQRFTKAPPELANQAELLLETASAEVAGEPPPPGVQARARATRSARAPSGWAAAAPGSASVPGRARAWEGSVACALCAADPLVSVAGLVGLCSAACTPQHSPAHFDGGWCGCNGTDLRSNQRPAVLVSLPASGARLWAPGARSAETAELPCKQ